MSHRLASVDHVDWSRRANLYEVNLRQYTAEGTLRAFQEHLPRLAAMGVDMLWLMPVQPIGVTHRKGTLGSYYSVADHCAVNPEFGTLADFQALVAAAHAAGMKVILDWVANHTAWDHVWTVQHPEWYLKDAAGELQAYVYDNGHALETWSDVVGLDYRQPALREAMLEALKFWVRSCDIDGYRCDVAMLVPMPFWARVRAELDAIKPVFLLAEAAGAAFHAEAFDMTYDWSLHDLLTTVRSGRCTGDHLMAWLAQTAADYPADAYRMTFTSNHDKNAWEGHDGEVYGPAFEACAVLAATLPGLPLIYGGQETGLQRRLAFFEKDAITWQDCPLAPLYTRLLALKHRHAALANGSAGAPVQRLATGNPALFAFRRAHVDDAVTVIVNLSGQAQPLHDAAPELAPALDGAGALGPWAWRIAG